MFLKMWPNIIHLIGQALLMTKNRDWCQVVIQIRHEQDVGPTVEYLSTFHTFYKYMPLAQWGHQVISMTVRQPIQVNKTSSHTSLSRLACLISFQIKFYSLYLFSRSQVLPSVPHSAGHSMKNLRAMTLLTVPNKPHKQRTALPQWGIQGPPRRPHSPPHG